MSTDAQPLSLYGDILAGRRVRLVGAFGATGLRSVQATVRRSGAVLDDRTPDLIVVGDEAHRADAAGTAVDASNVEVIDEGEFWRRLGLLDGVGESRDRSSRLYTPAMLAELVGAKVSAVKRWRRRGLLRPCRTISRLDFFDFGEARVAQTLTRLLGEGVSLAGVERQLERLAASHPWVDRPLAELPLTLEDGVVVVGTSLSTEASGQRRLSFADAPPVSDEPAVLALYTDDDPAPATLRERAWESYDLGELEDAIAAWRLVLLEAPPSADDHFVLAEWLAETGRTEAARERLYAALELDDEHPEARLALERLATTDGSIEPFGPGAWGDGVDDAALGSSFLEPR